MYTTNPHMPKVRRDAVNLVKYRHWSMRKVALRFGVEPSTVSRWCAHVYATGWHEIPTKSSRPHTSPNALKKEIVKAIMEKRIGRRRCGQHIYHELKREGIKVSLPSVQRTLDRLGFLKKRSLWKRPHDATPRPVVLNAGALIQLDTVHILAPDGSRIYIYTLIDLFSRWAYAEAVEKIGVNESVLFVRRAIKKSSFKFEMIQTDNGSEFSTWFTHEMWRFKINHRHSRVRKSNDNAHIERFNRTIQEECLDRTTHTISEFKKSLAEYLPYYNTKRIHMGINYQTPLEVLRSS
ncbi:MAG: integrase core domain-containing protein [Candidatus Paceibacterota bacterium]